MSLFFEKSRAEKKPYARLEHNSLIIRDLMLRRKIPYGEITSLEIRDEMKYGEYVGNGDRKGLKELGMKGIFGNSEFGVYDLCIKKSVKKYIVVRRINGRVLVFNLGTVEETYRFYDQMRKLVKQ